MTKEENFQLGKKAEAEQRALLHRMGYQTKEATEQQDYFEHTDYFLLYNNKWVRTDCKMYQPKYDNFLINFELANKRRGPMFCEWCDWLTFTIGDEVWYVDRKLLLDRILSELPNPTGGYGIKKFYPTFTQFTQGIWGPYITIRRSVVQKIGKKLPPLI